MPAPFPEGATAPPPALPFDADAIEAQLDPAGLIGPDRRQRVRGALAQRLSSVVVVCEAVHRRHNVSAILRSAECFGVHEVHLVMGEFRPSKGAARGAERWLELHLHPDLGGCLHALKARGYTVVVADLAPDAWTPDTVPVQGPVAILFGSELSGVSDEARALADGAVTVPMRGLTESLNVSVAAACVLQRVTERRRDRVGGGDLEPARSEAFYAQWLGEEVAERRGREARVGAEGAGAEGAGAEGAGAATGGEGQPVS